MGEEEVVYEKEKELPKKVVFCIPAYPLRPHRATLQSLRDSVPAVEAAGWLHGLSGEVGNPYISSARSIMLRKALDAKATDIVFIDHDVSWRPEDMVKLLETKGDVVAGTYRFKDDVETYMGAIFSGAHGLPVVRPEDGALKGQRVPAGFLRVTRKAVNRFIEAYPELCYGERCSPSIDLFNHGAHKWGWWGEDYSFSRNWIDAGGEIWIVPDMNIDHHTLEKAYCGNFHHYLCRQPGGSEDPENKKSD